MRRRQGRREVGLYICLFYLYFIFFIFSFCQPREIPSHLNP
jgi:hypothetical protein